MSTLTRKSLRQSLQLKACPRCGGDVCRMRDTFGVYHRCAQCGREIRATMPAAAARMPARDANDAGIASVATIANTGAAPAEATVANMTVPATATAATIATPAGIVAPAPSHPATDRIGKLLL